MEQLAAYIKEEGGVQDDSLHGARSFRSVAPTTLVVRNKNNCPAPPEISWKRAKLISQLPGPQTFRGAGRGVGEYPPPPPH